MEEILNQILENQLMISNKINQNQEQVNKKFEQVNKKLEEFDKKFEQINKEFEKIEKRFQEIYNEIFKIKEEIKYLRIYMDENFTSITEIFQLYNDRISKIK